MLTQPVLTLTSTDRKALEHLVTHVPLTRAAARAQALLWLDEGETVQAVASRFHVSRQTVYNWVSEFHKRDWERNLGTRLADKKRSGRPRTLPRTIDPLIATVIGHDPREFGYHAIVWNTRLLGQYLRDVHHLRVTRQSVSLALERLAKRWEPSLPAMGHPFPRPIASSPVSR